MNCKPNDLAVVVTTLGIPNAEPILGAIVKVIRLTEIDQRHGPMWLIEHAVILHGIAFNVIADAVLRPLRDPGDDAVDEMVRWCPAPKAVPA